jgi:hypothetical protein
VFTLRRKSDKRIQPPERHILGIKIDLSVLRHFVLRSFFGLGYEKNEVKVGVWGGKKDWHRLIELAGHYLSHAGMENPAEMSG